MLDELRKNITQAQGESTPEAAAERAIGTYKSAAGYIDSLKDVQADAKKLLSDIMLETGITSFSTQSGKLIITTPGTTTGIDTAKLLKDALTNTALHAAIQPYLSTKQTGGVMMIR